MKFKLKNGMEVDLHDEDIKTIMNTYKSWQDEEVDFKDMEKYFKDLHKHAISKMETISQMVISDEDSIGLAAVNSKLDSVIGCTGVRTCGSSCGCGSNYNPYTLPPLTGSSTVTRTYNPNVPVATA